MRILKDPLPDGSLRIRIETLDDLWYLHQLLDEGTIVGSHTFRKPESRDDMIRSDSQPRIRIYLKISMEESDFQPFTDALRIKGEIIEGPPDISGHHTINANIGSVLDIKKEKMTETDSKVLEEACKASGYTGVLAVSMDDETAEVYRFRDYGVERIAEIKAGQGGKMFGNDDKWPDYDERISEVLEREIGEDTLLLISGPGFFKEELAKYLREKGVIPSERTHLLNSSSGGLSGLKESLASDKGMVSAVSDIRFVRENQVMDELMVRIGRGSGATYGLREVKRALEMGAVETLLLTDTLFKDPEGKELMESTAKVSSSSMVISTSHEMGEMLEKLGGAGALLRFDIGSV
ncbi:MAG: mRNA surveillance protein pelota [Thermoplasmatota archaeon]